MCTFYKGNVDIVSIDAFNYSSGLTIGMTFVKVTMDTCNNYYRALQRVLFCDRNIGLHINPFPPKVVP